MRTSFLGCPRILADFVEGLYKESLIGFFSPELRPEDCKPRYSRPTASFPFLIHLFCVVVQCSDVYVLILTASMANFDKPSASGSKRPISHVFPLSRRCLFGLGEPDNPVMVDDGVPSPKRVKELGNGILSSGSYGSSGYRIGSPPKEKDVVEQTSEQVVVNKLSAWRSLPFMDRKDDVELFLQKGLIFMADLKDHLPPPLGFCVNQPIPSIEELEASEARLNLALARISDLEGEFEAEKKARAEAELNFNSHFEIHNQLREKLLARTNGLVSELKRLEGRCKRLLSERDNIMGSLVSAEQSGVLLAEAKVSIAKLKIELMNREDKSEAKGYRLGFYHGKNGLPSVYEPLGVSTSKSAVQDSSSSEEDPSEDEE